MLHINDNKMQVDTLSTFKKHLVISILRSGKNCIFLFENTYPDVSIPKFLTETQSYTLFEIGLNMHIPIDNLRVDEGGIFGTLNFSKKPHDCFVPWGAIVNIRSKDEAFLQNVDLKVQGNPAQSRKTPQSSFKAKRPVPKNLPKTKIKREIPPYLRVIK